MRWIRIKTEWNKLDYSYQRMVVVFVGMWMFWQFGMFSGAGYTLRHPLEYLLNYMLIVTIPTIVSGLSVTYLLNKWYPSIKINKQALVAKRKEALEKRLKKEANVRMINIAGKAVFYLAIVPYSQFLARVFPRSKRVAEYGMSVIRRYRLYPIAEAISRPTHKHGHYLQIIEYLVDEESAWLVLSPRIGVAKARRIIEKRLAKYDLKLANSALYTVEGNRLYVGVSKHSQSSGLRGQSL